MPLGHIDAVTSSGLVEGWAYDEQRPGEPLLISVVDAEETEAAVGLANLYRRDLAEVRHAYGWCYFRLKLTKPPSLVRDVKLKLVAKQSQDRLFGPQAVQYMEHDDYEVETIADIIAADPTVLASPDQIDGCDEIFDKFIKARGVDAFVRAAYVYVLGRSIDGEGLVLYNRLIRQKRLTPYAMLRTLSDSAEFRSRPRSLVAPTSAGFPFRTDL